MSPARISFCRKSGFDRMSLEPEIVEWEVTASGWWADENLTRGDARAQYRGYSDRALVEAMRALDANALEEFIERFQHLALLQARRLRIRHDERKGWVADLLYDVASSLCRQPHGAAPGALAPYLITACKRKVFASKRNSVVRERTDAELMGELGGAGDAAMLTTCSEDSVRRTYGPGVEAAELSPVLERLVSTFEQGTSIDERMLLGWVAERTPYSLIATWLGITRSGAIKRVTRLRGRLVDATVRFGESLDRNDRAELLRFLRRSDTDAAADLEGLADAQPELMRRQAEPTLDHRDDTEEEGDRDTRR